MLPRHIIHKTTTSTLLYKQQAAVTQQTTQRHTNRCPHTVVARTLDNKYKYTKQPCHNMLVTVIYRFASNSEASSEPPIKYT